MPLEGDKLALIEEIMEIMITKMPEDAEDGYLSAKFEHLYELSEETLSILKRGLNNEE